MIIDETAGSGGDLLPWMFRKYKLGPLVGKRTWGGLVGILGFPVLMDGGTITAPNLAIWTPEDGWVVENEGVPPDIEVEQTPADVIAGRDPQLEKAIEVVMAELKKNPPKQPEAAGVPGRGRRCQRRAPAAADAEESGRRGAAPSLTELSLPLNPRAKAVRGYRVWKQRSVTRRRRRLASPCRPGIFRRRERAVVMSTSSISARKPFVRPRRRNARPECQRRRIAEFREHVHPVPVGRVPGIGVPSPSWRRARRSDCRECCFRIVGSFCIDAIVIHCPR